MVLPDWRRSTFTKHGKTADARKRKLAHLAVKPNETKKAAALAAKLPKRGATSTPRAATSTPGAAERIAALTRHVNTLQAQLETARRTQAQLAHDLRHSEHKLAQARAKNAADDAERHKAVQRYSDIFRKHSELIDKYNALCDMVQASICAPIDPYGSFGDDGLNGALTSAEFRAEIEADLAQTQARRLCIQLGDKTPPPPPERPLDAIY